MTHNPPRPPDAPYCKGAWNLRTACGECSRCKNEAPAYIELLRQRLAQRLRRRHVRQRLTEGRADAGRGRASDAQRDRRRLPAREAAMTQTPPPPLPRKSLEEAMAALQTDTERRLFTGCVLALGALRAVGMNREYAGANQVARMLADAMDVVDPWPHSPPPSRND